MVAVCVREGPALWHVYSPSLSLSFTVLWLPFPAAERDTRFCDDSHLPQSHPPEPRSL